MTWQTILGIITGVALAETARYLFIRFHKNRGGDR